MESEKATMVGFASAQAASRRVAGVAAAARAARSLAEQGVGAVTIAVPGGILSPAAQADLDRVAPGTRLADADCVGPVPAAPALSAAAILRATGKASDGPVSRWFNRPVSRALSALLLALWPGVRPLHATIGTALIALAMFALLVFGGAAGLIAGGILFHAASVFDGVDGEIARATWRTSPAGAALDTIVDMATNLLFLVGLVANLALRGVPYALPLGLWALGLVAIGLAAMSWRSARSGGAFTLDLVKQEARAGRRGPLDLLLRFGAVLTSRDTFALLFALLILTGLPMVALGIFAAVATIWLLFVGQSILLWNLSRQSKRSA